ncbi:hypothetical protein [Siphonobacter curvatus]|uniref:Uncharacterized protein n=1 Tax=Siphonobacter curvatus TaxID=2094562 RepID=A0A2S7INM0_9BACT|nr:hypothetical protein [Siphonobacter curvatus]PQA59160.1 hypothetical protein C5O19_05755 [Siphonobacter curvatus]
MRKALYYRDLFVFYLACLLALPFTFLFYLGTDLVKLKWPMGCVLKTQMVYQSVRFKFRPKRA